MKIEDFNRYTSIKADSPQRTHSETGLIPAVNASGITAGKSVDDHSAIPDMLKKFGQILEQRQVLFNRLPASVKVYLEQSTQLLAGEGQPIAGQGKSSIQQGISAFMRENRLIPEVLRQIISELEFFEPFFLRSAAGTETPAVNLGKLFDAAKSESFNASVDETLRSLMPLALHARKTATPVHVFSNLLHRAGGSGILSKELSNWLTQLGPILDALPGDSVIVGKARNWLENVDPRVTRIVLLTGQPKLIQVWAAVQSWGSERIAPYGEITPQDDAEVKFLSVLYELTHSALVSETTSNGFFASAILSRSRQYEQLIALIGSRPEMFEQVLRLLQNFLSLNKHFWADQKSDRRVEDLTDEPASSLIHLVPRWLRAISEQLGSRELTDFWAAAKAADLKTWSTLGREELSLALETLKELVVTFDRSETFRFPRETNGDHGIMLPVALIASDERKPYPAFIQVYRDKNHQGGLSEQEPEIWFRISLETEHLGMIDLSFRLQNRNSLTLFGKFSDSTVSSDFQELLPEIYKEISMTSIMLQNVIVGPWQEAGVEAYG